MYDLDEVRLSSSVTVAAYRELLGKQDQAGPARFIEERLTERYVTPLLAIPREKKHGFALMALACLLVESLESFYNGWDDNHTAMRRDDVAPQCRPSKSTISRSEVAFCYFFQREYAFAIFRPLASAFYRHVRCGVLHQGETTGGWRINRKANAPLFDPDELSINANKFLQQVSTSVDEYATKLRSLPWDDRLWASFRKKMVAIIEHCEK